MLRVHCEFGLAIVICWMFWAWQLSVYQLGFDSGVFFQDEYFYQP